MDPFLAGPSRRVFLKGAAAAAVVAAGALRAEAQQKAPQKMVQYQEKPKGDQECDKCLHFVAPNSCKLVEGKINPKGWCALYAPKPK
jgi:anaerobic selenocysteine-containing dehydrogenase